MADIPMVENPGEQQFEPAYGESSDVKAVAEDLKSKGFSKEDVQAMAETLPLNPTALGSLMKEYDSGFFDNTAEDTSFFDQSPDSSPVPPLLAAERATLVTVQADGLEGLNTDVVRSVQSELEVYGYSAYEKQARAQVREQLKAPLTDAALDTFELQTPADAQELAGTVRDEAQAVDARDEIADLIVGTLDSLPRGYDVFYQDIVNQTLADRAMSSIIDSQVKTEWDQASVSDIVLDFGEAVFGGQIVTSRAFQTEVLDKLGLTSGSASEYVFKSDDVNALHNYVRAGKNAEDQLDRLEEIVQIVSDTNSPLGENIVYRMDFLTNLRNELEKQGAGAGVAVFDDIFDVAEVGFLAKAASKATQAIGAKLFGSIASANKSLTPDDVQYLQGVMQDVVDSLAPSQGRVHAKGKIGVTEIRGNAARTEQGSLLDAIATNNPEALRTVLNASEESGQDVLQNLGVTPEGFVARLTPTGSVSNGVSYASTEKFNKLQQVSSFDYSALNNTREEFNRLTQGQNISDILTEAELEGATVRAIQKVHTLSGGTLHPHKSWEALELEDDVIKARAIFGKDAESGYDSIQDAQAAMRNLFSDQGRITAQVRGRQGQYELDELEGIPETDIEYFVDTTVEHQVTSRDVNPLEGKVDSYLPFHSYLVPFSQRVEREVVDSALAYTDKASRISQVMQEFTAPIGKLRGKKERDQWVRLLTHGDEHGVVFSKAAAREMLGQMSDRVWEAYVGTRSFYDGMAIIRNKAHRAGLSERGFKGVRDLADDKGNVFGLPMVQRPRIVREVTEDSLQEVQGTKIYDAESGVSVDLTDSYLDSVYDSGMVVIKNHRPVRANGELFDFSVVRADRVTDLPHKTMNTRKGHIDLNYLGEDGFFTRYIGRLFGTGHKGGTGAKVMRTGSAVRNGVSVEHKEVVGIYRDTKQAQQAVEDLGGTDDLEVISTREAVSDLGVDDAGTMSHVPSHARGRGQRLLGPSGHAEVADVEESLGRALAEARRFTGLDSVNVLKNKFLRTYGRYLEDVKNGFPEDFARTRWRDRDKPEVQAKIRDAKAYHAYIKNQENALTGTIQVKWLEDLRASVAAWKMEGGAFQEFIGTAAQSFLDKDFVKIGTQLTAGVFIAARPLYQTLANAAQSAFLFAQNPVRFSTYTVPNTISVLTALMLRDTRQGALATKVLAKPMGMQADEFSTYLQNMKDSGMLSTAMVDDLFGLFDSNMKVIAGRNSLRSSEFWKSMLPGGGLGGRAMSAAMAPQRVSTDLSNVMAYVHATAKFKKDNPYVSVNSPLGKRTILGEARRLTYTQNRADQFTYQQNLLSVQLQFMQHVHKMFLNLVVDPTVNVASLGKLSLSRKGTNPWGGTFAQSALTLGTITAMFGLESKLSGKDSVPLTEALQEAGASPDMIDVFMDGVLGKVTEEVYGEELDLASRFSPIGFVQSTLGLMFTHDGALNLAGPAGSLWKTMGNMAEISKAYWSDGEISDEEGALLMNEAAKVFAGLNDYERYQVAMNFGEYRTSSGRKIADISTEAAIPILFSVPPKAVQRYYDTLDEVMDVQRYTQNVVRSVNSYVLNTMNDQAWESITSEDVARNMAKGFRLIDAAFAENPAAALEAKNKLAKEFIRPESDFMQKYAVKLAGRLSPADAVTRLKQMQQNNPEVTDVTNQLIEVLQSKLEEE